MREYGQVQTSFWSHPDIQALTDDGKLLALYCLTGPHSNGIGCYRLPDGYVMADLGWTPERVSKGFQELFAAGFGERCETTNFFLIPKFMQWNPVSNPNVASAREKEFHTIPKKAKIHKGLCDSMKRYGKHWSKAFETLLQTSSKQEKTLPNPTQPNDSPEPPRVSAPKGDDSPILIEIPLNDKSAYPITKAQVGEWTELYPAIDVEQELRNMRGWCLSNPTRRKTKNGVLKFVNGWLAREQDSAKSKVAQFPQPRYPKL